MDSKIWTKLCRSIYERKCILLIGSEFQIEIDEGNKLNKTNFSELLSKKLMSEMITETNLNSELDPKHNYSDLAQVAQKFMALNSKNAVQAREDLEIYISDYLSDITPKLSSDTFTELTNLPFDFIVDTNYGNLFYDLLIANNKNPKKGYYHFKGDQIHLSQMGSESEPLVYNLYGSISKPRSLVVTDFDLTQFLCGIISKSPALPADIRVSLANEDTTLLLIGFGMLKRNWYFKILLHALTVGKKNTMSYALEYLSAVNYDDDNTVLFFRDELKVSLFNSDQSSFVQQLNREYRAFLAKQHVSNSGAESQKSMFESPTVFVSYKHDDRSYVEEIIKELKAKSINVLWDAHREFTGSFEERIEEWISNSDAFLLLQSKSLIINPVNYVNIEIRLAIKRAKQFTRMDYYLYPAYIDVKESRLVGSDFKEFTENIQSWDLSELTNIHHLVKEIIRNQQRTKKVIAA